MIKPVVLSGGVGQRLWPVSRKFLPKQFVELFGNTSLFEATVDRLNNSVFDDVTVVTTHDQRHFVRQQLSKLEIDGNIVVEPSGKNTMASVLAACHEIAETSTDAIMCVFPSDHHIPNTDEFISVIKSGYESAKSGDIVTFGVTPDRAATGYGYIETDNSDVVENVIRFVEKPDKKTAQKMLQTGKFSWNMGIFLFRVDVMLSLAKTYALNIASLVEAAYINSKIEYGCRHLNVNYWSQIDSISIDHAIMEKISNIKLVKFRKAWSDLGDFNAISDFFERDDANNSISGNAHQLFCEGSTLWSVDSDQILVGLGLKDIVAVSTKDAVLVAHSKDTQKVKDVVLYLEHLKCKQVEMPTIVQRPWGSCNSLVETDKYMVSVINIKPSKKYTLRNNKYQNNHYVIVSGTATTVLNNKKITLVENEAIVVQSGEDCQLTNEKDTELFVIEVLSSFDRDGSNSVSYDKRGDVILRRPNVL